MNAAYRSAGEAGTLGKTLVQLFQHSFSAAKKVRSDTAIGTYPVSVAFAAVNPAQKIFTGLNRQTAPLIGAGNTIELAARHRHKHRHRPPPGDGAYSPVRSCWISSRLMWRTSLPIT